SRGQMKSAARPRPRSVRLRSVGRVELAAQGADAHPEQLRRFGAVVPGDLERLSDQRLLGLGHVQGAQDYGVVSVSGRPVALVVLESVGWASGVEARRQAEAIRVERARLEDLCRAQDHRALDRVLQFP